MKKIIVGFSWHPTAALSRLIKFVTKSQVSHTYTRVKVGTDELIYQASGLTVNYTALPVFLEKNVIVEEYEVEVSDEVFAEAKRTRLTQVGKPYSMKQLVGYLWVLFMRQAMGKKIANPYGNGDQSYVCVEIVTKCIGLAGGESMTPEDLRRWCEKNGSRL